MDTMIGRVLNEKYKIVEFIGQGGMAKVYRARDMRLGRDVAVKILKSEFTDNEQFLKKFLREAQADARLAHPNIVNVYDIGAEPGLYYIVMEYINGCTLKEYIRANKRLDQKETVSLTKSIAKGLLHAHQNNIIHRDVKPHNILLTADAVAKIADFGIARAITSSTVTANEDALGSVHYISPEQAKGGFLDERSDLYSLGIMLYEMLTGELPYNADTPVAVAFMHLENNVPEVKSKVRSISSGVNQMVLNLTRRKPDERYQNAQALLDDLKKLEQDINADIKPTYNVDQKSEKHTKNPKVQKTSKKHAPTGKPKEPFYKNKRNLAILIAGGVVLIVGIIAVIHGLSGEKIPMIDLRGMNMQQASKELKKLDLKYEISGREFSKEYPKDTIISHIPAANEKIKKNGVVNLIVSDGPDVTAVPDVTGKYESEAKDMLTKAGFVVSNVKYEFNQDYKNGTVFDQNPRGGIEAKEGTNVTIYVSKGEDSVTIPKVTEMSYEDAKKMIEKTGLSVGKVRYESSLTYSKGIVIRQSPNAYNESKRNASVDLVVSSGKISYKTLKLDISKYTDSQEAVQVKIELTDPISGNSETVYNQRCFPEDAVTVTLKGSGTMIYKIYIDGEEKHSREIDF